MDENESPEELTARLWDKFGAPGVPWPWPGVLIVKTPVTEDDERVARSIMRTIRRATRPEPTDEQWEAYAELSRSDELT